MFTISPFLLPLLSFLLSFFFSYPYIQSLFFYPTRFSSLFFSFRSSSLFHHLCSCLRFFFSSCMFFDQILLPQSPANPAQCMPPFFFILCKFSVISSYLVASINIYSLMQEKIKIKRRQCCGVKCDEIKTTEKDKKTKQ